MQTVHNNPLHLIHLHKSVCLIAGPLDQQVITRLYLLLSQFSSLNTVSDGQAPQSPINLLFSHVADVVSVIPVWKLLIFVPLFDFVAGLHPRRFHLIIPLLQFISNGIQMGVCLVSKRLLFWHFLVLNLGLGDLLVLINNQV